MPQTYLIFFCKHFLLNFVGETNLASMISNEFVVMQKQWNYMLEFLTLIVQLIIYYILHNKIMSKRNCTRDQVYIPCTVSLTNRLQDHLIQYRQLTENLQEIKKMSERKLNEGKNVFSH